MDGKRIMSDLNADFIQIWNKGATCFPEFELSFSKEEQIAKEDSLNSLSFKLKQWEKSFDACDGDAEKRIFEELRNFFQQNLNYSSGQLEVIFSEEMAQSTYHFIQAARMFDPEINFHDVFQAGRNVWIMNGLQYLAGAPVRLTPSIFAYSMLYPYTDNYIDNPEISAFDKYEFSLRFADRLSGEPVLPINEQEEKIFRMVEIIEDEWDRVQYPEVYKSLLGIHQTQTASARLLNTDGQLTPAEALSICIDKGGSSVVADGCLIFGSLSPKQEKFFFTYGAYLQLLDDLQDLTEDLNDGLYTWHGFQAEKGRMEVALNNTWWAGQLVLKMVDELESDNGEVFKELMSKSIDLFLIESVTNNGSYFRSEYADRFEKHSPFRFSFIRKRSGSFTPFQDQFFKNIERLAKRSKQPNFDFLKKESLPNNFQQAQ